MGWGGGWGRAPSEPHWPRKPSEQHSIQESGAASCLFLVRIELFTWFFLWAEAGV